MPLVEELAQLGLEWLPRASGSGFPQLNDYLLSERLGGGASGTVFLAQSSKRGLSNIRYAIKVLRLPAPAPAAPADVATEAAIVERFLRSAERQVLLTHTNVMGIRDVGKVSLPNAQRVVPYIVMPYTRGMTLGKLIEKRAPLKVEHVLQIGMQLALGLGAAHATGLVHLDIKPDNVWMSEENRRPNERKVRLSEAKLLDFGSARFVGTARPPSNEFRTANAPEAGFLVGTLGYLAPELVKLTSYEQLQTVDERADLYSLGVVLYQMASARLPFPRNNPGAYAVAQYEGKPASLLKLNPHIPGTLAELVSELLAFDPAKRPASADAVAERLRAILEGTSGSEGPSQNPFETLIVSDPTPTGDAVPVVPAAPPGSERNPSRLVSVLLAGLALVLAISTTILLLRPNRNESPLLPPPSNGPDSGSVAIESLAEFELVAEQHGRVVTRTRNKRFNLEVGDYQLRLVSPTNGSRLEPASVSVTKNSVSRARVVPPPAPPVTNPVAAQAIELLQGDVQLELRTPAGKITVERRDLVPNDATAIVTVRAAGTSEAFFRVLPTVSTLEVLRVGNAAELTDAFVKSLQAKGLVEVRFIGAKQLTDEAVTALANPKLRVLDLSGSQITQKGVQVIAALSLNELLLNGCNQMADQELEPITAMKTLTTLAVEYTQLSNDGLMKFARAKSLKSIDVRKTQVTEQGVQAFNDVLPNCQVRFTKP